MSTNLREQINNDMKNAMRAKEAAKLSAIRLLLAAIKQKEVDERVTLDDAAVVSVVEKLVKQRKDSVSQYEAAQREDLAAAERFEIEVLTAYLPARLSTEEITSVISRVVGEIKAAGLTGPAVMGKAMGQLKAELAGKADMGEVSAILKSQL